MTTRQPRSVRVRQGGRTPARTRRAAGSCGESPYDQVTSFLMAVVLGAILVVGWLALVYVSNQAYASRVTSPLQIIEVSGGGGGQSRGDARLDREDRRRRRRRRGVRLEQRGRAGRLRGAFASSRPRARCSTRSPRPARTWPRSTSAPSCPAAGPSPAASAASKLGTGGPGLGSGPATAAFAPEQRWSIIFNEGQSPEEYARQLDALGVELAVVVPPEPARVRLQVLQPRSRPSDSARAGATTASISSGKGGAEGVGPRAPEEGGHRGRRERRAPVLSRRGRGAARASSSAAIAAGSRPRSASRGSRSCPSGNSYDFKVIAQEALR